MIQTKVAKILSPTNVILAAGFDDGVKEGMEFVIYDLSETIRDPETGDDLGQLELVKGYVYAVNVQDKLTWAQTKPRKIDLVRAMGLGGLARVVQDELLVEGASPIAADRVVRVGDKARSVYQPELARAEITK